MPKYGWDHVRRRRAVLERDNWTCNWCGNEATEADHLFPVMLAGTPDCSVDDMVASCKRCNARRGAKLRHDTMESRQRHPFFSVEGGST